MSGSNQSWQNQGRQEHGWFGHGTGSGGVEDRAAAVAYGAIAALPRSLRGRAADRTGSGPDGPLQTLLLRWSRGFRLGKDEFASRFFGRDGGDGVAQALHAAASGIASAKSHSDLREASEQVAKAMERVGLDRWQRFLADAQSRADDPATMLAVAHSQPAPTLHLPMLDAKAAQPPVTRVADVTPPEAPAAPAVAAEPEHGAIWRWLHSLGLAKTRHEQATELRRVMGSSGGLVYMREGVPLNVDEMSDDEVLALNKETRGKPHGPPLIGAAAPIRTPWGWKGTLPYQKAKAELEQPGTHETLNGRVPTLEEAEQMIADIKGTIVRREPPHSPEGRSTHTYYHINYKLKNGVEATVRVQAWE